MVKKKNNRRRSSAEIAAIRRYYAQKAQHISAAYPHFRYYRKSGHPALIVGEQINSNSEEEYRFRKVMHGDRDGRHLNEKVFPNPNPNDPDPMYIARRAQHDLKSNFENKPLPWNYPKKDK